MNTNKVRCNFCYWVGDDEYLKTLALSINNPTSDNIEYIKCCPNCETDNYLMDIENEQNKD